MFSFLTACQLSDFTHYESLNNKFLIILGIIEKFCLLINSSNFEHRIFFRFRWNLLVKQSNKWSGTKLTIWKYYQFLIIENKACKEEDIKIQCYKAYARTEKIKQ